MLAPITAYKAIVNIDPILLDVNGTTSFKRLKLKTIVINPSNINPKVLNDLKKSISYFLYKKITTIINDIVLPKIVADIAPQ